MRWFLLCALLAGCSSTPILLRHPDGRTAECGPFSTWGIINQLNIAERERDCVQQFQQAGYERSGR